VTPRQAPETQPFFGTLFRAPNRHTFWRNRTPSGQKRQTAPKSAAVFERFSTSIPGRLPFGQTVRVEMIDVDRYKREVGRIFLGERFINMEMVRDGFAWRYIQYDKPGEFTAAENDAREHRGGLWTDSSPVPPWEWRKMKRQAAKWAH
jgi:endonuclease YncB( thermonuclease family)